MMPSVSGHRCSPESSIQVVPPSPARSTAAAAPSPNRAMATMLALVSSSSRSASEQSSIVTSSTLLPGRASGEPRRNRQARHAAGAAEAEHRNPRDVGAEAHTPRDARLEARRRDARRAHGHDRIDIAGFEVGGGECLLGGVDEQRLGALEKRRGALRPALVVEIPVERLDAVALGDSGIGENCRQFLELGKARSEMLPRCGENILLQMGVRGHRGRKRKQ